MDNIEHHEVRLIARLNLSVSHKSITIGPEAKSYRLWPKWVNPYKVAKIKELPIFPQVHDMILNGKPDSEVGRAIQDAGLCLDEEFSTLTAWISHYRATVPKALILVRNMPDAVLKAKKRVDHELDMIASADELYKWQRERVVKAIARERSIDYILPSIDKEILSASLLLDKCLKMRQAIGLTDPQLAKALSSSTSLERFDLSKSYSRIGINEKLQDPVSRIKILNAVEKIIDLSSRRLETSDAPIVVGHDIISVDPINNTTESKEISGLEVLGELDISKIQKTAKAEA